MGIILEDPLLKDIGEGESEKESHFFRGDNLDEDEGDDWGEAGDNEDEIDDGEEADEDVDKELRWCDEDMD